MALKQLIFDADDTLWYTTILYQESKKKFATLMQAQGIDPEIALATLTKVDIAQVQEFGFKRLRFPSSMVATYKQLSKDPLPAIVKDCHDIGDSVFSQTAENIPHVKEVIETLHARFPLILVTRGDQTVQLNRLHQSGLRRFFHAVHIVNTKHADLYRSILKQHKLTPRETCSIGDSLKSDVLPAIEVGMAGIWIPNNNWSDFEKAEPPTGLPWFKQLESLTQLPEALTSWP